ncbi:glycosyltransferase [Staphylococcus canis]|uniref:Glycosyltransferase n=1 Tax=Staphylococcus canis TaxID=2724942 RepID=A0ABS0T9J6_9STAP|nr:glycosyltransferase [Staphylococcus canis]MBI5975392.1 glycosyltransferase [Staphylococcus canis]
MNLKTLKYLLFGKMKPFQMTEKPIDIKSEENEVLKSISEIMDINPGEATYKINQLGFLSEYVDYLKVFHQTGKGDLSSVYDDIDIDEAIVTKDLFLNYKVGIIADTFLYRALEGSCHLKYINHNGQDDDYDFVIIASTWKGIDGYWEGNTNINSEKYEELTYFIRSLKKRNIPVIFFNKEDPVNFDVFKMHAKEVGTVITTEVSYKEKYRQLIGNDQVYHTHFPINPSIHNPINKSHDTNQSVVFAGSWVQKYQERINDTRTLFDGVIRSDYDLTIFDRNLWLDQTKYQFPSNYIKYIAAPLTHEQTMKMHKLHPNAINLNTIKYSSSMCANRVFELQAMGNFLISNYNTFVNMAFPQVQMIFNENDVQPTLELDALLLDRAKSSSIQNMMLNFNHFKWLRNIAIILGFTAKDFKEPTITVIKEPTDIDIETIVARQSYDNIIISEPGEQITTPYYTYFSSQHEYESDYLKNMVAATMYADVEFITNSDIHDEFVNAYSSKYLTLFKTGITNYRKGYTLGKTYIDNHPLEHNLKTPELSIIVPVHNNGSHLEHKCLRSIIKNKDFERFEVILVDDGSSDKTTIEILKFFDRRYPNIQLIHLDEASGSASTPRNIGIQNAKSDYITFLDPDNEWVGDGINQLLHRIKSNAQIDMVIGNMLKVDNEKTQEHNYYHYFTNYAQSEVTNSTQELLRQTKLKTASIQALIVKKSLITSNNIRMVPGALGQDSLFFLEIMHNANHVEVIDTMIHVYYAAVLTSMTNTISKSFFEKYILIEKEKISFLKKNNYLDVYMNHRFNYYMKNWYIKRIRNSNVVDQPVIEEFLKLYSLYEGIKRPVDKALENEIKNLKSEV